MTWTVDFTDKALKQLKRLEGKDAKRILSFMGVNVAGADNPRLSGKALSGKLGDLWSYRVGDFRIICDIQDKLLRVLVVVVGNRRDVYRIKK